MALKLNPATMKLLGARKWYLPAWLRWLPQVNVERVRHPVLPGEVSADEHRQRVGVLQRTNT